MLPKSVAVSKRPDGGFVDAGKRLTFEEFAIDAHVFIDDDGSRYMFYATDFLEHTHIGTGTVVEASYEYGNTFLIVAGLLNMLVMIDAYDVALGRK